jgi:murein DD-endopeptidase MepM/ murein hydrolase activator NlpD
LKSIKKLFLLLIIVGLISAGVFYFRDTKQPQISLTPGSGPISKKSKIMLALNDEGMGLKNIQVTVIQGTDRMSLIKRDFPAQTSVTDIEIDLSTLKLKQGGIQIEVLANDHSIYHLGKGNSTQEIYTLTYDTRPPVISILSKAHNFTKGGSGLVTFNINEEAENVGVQFGDYFFPAYIQESGNYACLFAYPYDTNDKTFVPRVVATDLAGNERQAGIYYRANNKKFRQRKIKISDSFLAQKTPEFEAFVSKPGDPVEIFLQVNGEIRQQNRDQITELGYKTSAQPLWEGAFLRQPQTATLAQFADHRTYYYSGKAIDKKVHLGQDLASVAQAEIIAENSGEVVWAEYLGIYGQCVVIDHGLGLQSLYAHMSQLSVQPGDFVSRGQIIGRSGATGMAGGDHLHLGIFVSGVPVQPIEWWDKSWLKNNIDSKLPEN